MQKATVIKIGNSLGVRLRHQLVVEQNLKLGDIVEISLRPQPTATNVRGFIEALKQFQSVEGAFRDIENPVAWQQEIRRDRSLGREE